MLTRKRFLWYMAAGAGTLLLPSQALTAVLGETQPVQTPIPHPGHMAAMPTAQAASSHMAQAGVSSLGAVPGGTLDPRTLTKYAAPLVIPQAMPQSPVAPPGLPPSFDYYDIAARQFSQQVLPPGLPQTTVWGYGLASDAGTFSYPGRTIEAHSYRGVWIKWINELIDNQGHYQPHLLPVDPTLHWANPPGGLTGRDTRPVFTATPAAYTGPVPLVAHLHGAHTTADSDGFPEAWTLPAATNIPAGYATTGTWYDRFKVQSRFSAQWTPGASVSVYPNDQAAATLWYHDHTLGLTRLNVYAGLAGFYLVRGGAYDLPVGVLPGPAPAYADPAGTKYYEIPLVIQDRSFNADGSLFYPAGRAFFDNINGPYIPTTDVSPIWNPHTLGNTIVVNGRTWPALQVEARRYRFRFLNACNSRTLLLQLAGQTVTNPAVIPAPALPIHQIGGDGGFLPAPVSQDRLLLATAERADVILDFTGVQPGTQLFLLNLAPDGPYRGGAPVTDFAVADPDTTGQVLRFDVVAPSGPDSSTPVQNLQLPTPPALGNVNYTRSLSLNEMASTYPGFAGKVSSMMVGLVAMTPAGPTGLYRMWGDPPTETPAVGTTEIWEIYNFTTDAHPVHIHPGQFQVVNREPILGGAVRPPESGETAFKDTVIALPAEITRIKARFDIAGRFVWHCHMLEHEDNEMMRPLVVSHKNFLLEIWK
jgi:spore coat protein A, manganese oxidase